jgi:hypothetical protein
VVATKLAKILGTATIVVAAVGCAAPAPSAQENEGETGSYLLAGPVLSAAQVAGYVRAAGFPESMVGKMVCTAKYESSFYQKASNGTHYGLFQISKQHLGKTSGCVSTVAGIYDPANNAKCAFGVYKAQGLGAWEAYTSHKSTCDKYKAPASAATTASPSDDTSSSSTVPIPTPRPTDADQSDSSSDDTTTDSSINLSGGGCFSATLNQMMDESSCVESGVSSDYGVWFQCHQGQWYRGGNSSTGPYGACTSSNGLSASDDSTTFASVH